MSTAPKPIVKPGSGNVLVKVHACSFSPSDYRMMSGDTNLIKKPKAWPYIPGTIVCQTLPPSTAPARWFPFLTECIGPSRRKRTVRHNPAIKEFETKKRRDSECLQKSRGRGPEEGMTCTRLNLLYSSKPTIPCQPVRHHGKAP